MPNHMNRLNEEEAMAKTNEQKQEEFKHEITQDILRVGSFLQNEERMDADTAGTVIEDLERTVQKINNSELINWEEGL